MSQTRPIRVKNADFLLDLLHADTAPFQQYRELFQNGIEAIQAGKGKGNVLATYAEDFHREYKLWKLCIVDDGIGMTAEEMQRHIAELVCSSKEQGLDANYGIGARITAGHENPIGVVFRSWKDGKGAEVQFWKDPATGRYGLRREQAKKGGDFTEVFEPAWKPPQIKDHGTCVILLGQEKEEDTCRKPDLGAHWLGLYLNSRYFKFPEGIRVRYTPFRSKAGEPKEVLGKAATLAELTTETGAVKLSDAEVRWWILPEKTHIDGSIGALWKNELYETRDGKQRNSLLQQFGIVLGGARIVLYIEPTKGEIRSDASRRRLTLKGEPLPWDRWAEEFREVIPEALLEFQRELLERAEKDRSNTESDALKARLLEIRDLLQIKRYRPGAQAGLQAGFGEELSEVPTTHVDFDAESAETEREPKVGIPNDPRFPTNPQQAKSGKEDEDNAHTEPPEVSWVSVANGTRAADDGMEDKAALYDPMNNRVLMNSDYRGYGDLLDNIVNHFQLRDDAVPMVRGLVRQEAACAVVESVMSVRTLAGSKYWDLNALDAAWCPEALTSVVMVRSPVLQAIRRKLAQTVGRKKKS
jgi:hypothetical protein